MRRDASLRGGIRRAPPSFLAAALGLVPPAPGLAGARASESGEWRRRGARSPAHDLAQRSGTTVAAAADALEAARRLGELPVLAGAARRGEVSAQQVAAIADAATAAPGAEAALVASSKHSSLAELRDECARTKAAARPDEAEARHAEIHRTRRLRTFTDREGAWNLSVRTVAEVGAEFMVVLRAFEERIFRRARAEGRRESFEAYGADALAEMVRVAAAAGRSRAAGRTKAGERAADGGADGPAAEGAAGATEGEAPGPAEGDGPGPSVAYDEGAAHRGADGAGRGGDDSAAAALRGAERTGKAGGPADGPGSATDDDDDDAGIGPAVASKVIVRVDFDALVRGFPSEGEVCEIPGIGPVPVSVVRAMLASGNAVLAVVVTKGVDVVNVAHLGRRATAHQLSALQWRDPECPALGCSEKAFLEIDHREDWAETKITLLGLLQRPCKHHHSKKTREGWAFVPGVGKRPMVPPDDPRHPNNVGRGGAERGTDPGSRVVPAPEAEAEPESGWTSHDPRRAA